jgi:hypothetical protein
MEARRVRAITISVHYDDLLAASLAMNASHFDEVLVVTAPQDERTRAVVAHSPAARCFVTDAFYRDGAAFNKGRALEEGFDVLGRSGWLCIFDADTLLPRAVDLMAGVDGGHIHTPRRRICLDPAAHAAAILEEHWQGFPRVPDGEPAGYCQIFHADDPHLRRPWYGVDWKHAGGCDSDFNQHWPRDHWRWLPWECLHLGPQGQNWHGRQTLRLDGAMPEDAQRHAQAQHAMFALRSVQGTKGERL